MYTMYKWSQKFKCKILYYVCFSGEFYKGMQEDDEADEDTNMKLGRVVAISASMLSPEGVGIFRLCSLTFGCELTGLTQSL